MCYRNRASNKLITRGGIKDAAFRKIANNSGTIRIEL
jgi:hypothetical protein